MSGVLVVGDVITDIIVMPEGPMVRGSDRRATIRSRPGGSGANQAVWLGSMGVKVRFAARVAAADREANIAYFRSRAVEPILAGDATAPSGVLISVVDADGERSFLTDRGANLNLTDADLPASLLDGVEFLLVSGYSFFTPGPRAAVMALIKEAKERKIGTAVDPASVGFLREVGPEAFLKWTQGTRHHLCQSRRGAGTDRLGRPQFADADARPLLRTGHHQARRRRRGDRRPDRRADLDAGAAQRRGRHHRGRRRLRGGIPRLRAGGRPVDACLKAGIDAGAEAVTKIGGQPVTS